LGYQPFPLKESKGNPGQYDIIRLKEFLERRKPFEEKIPRAERKSEAPDFCSAC
jgi:hypothetical protein